MRRTDHLAVNRRRTGGAVLALTLVLLMLLALTVAATVRSNSVQSLLMANQQRSIELEQLADRALEAVVSDADNFMACRTTVVGCGEIDRLAAAAGAALQCTVSYVGKQSGLGCSINLNSTAPCHADYLWDVRVAVLDEHRDSGGDFAQSTVGARQGLAFFHRAGLAGCD